MLSRNLEMNESKSPIRPEGSNGLCLQVFGEFSISLNHSLSTTWCLPTIDCMLKIATHLKDTSGSYLWM